MSKVLSVLISINVQAKSDINLGGQRMVITNQGVAIQPCFHASKTYAIYKMARGRGTDPRSPACSTARQRALLRSHRGLRRIQTDTQSRKRNKSFIVELESEIIKI